MKANQQQQGRWGHGGPAHLDDDMGHVKTNVNADNVARRYEENLEEPTMRAGTGGNLLASAPRHGTLDEPTVERGDYGSGNMRAPAQSSLPDVMIGQLVVTDGNDMGNVYPMTGLPMSVGRALGNDIVLTDIAVSRKHMSVEFNGRQYKLVDHGSGNGTLVNDRLETGTCLLHHGDRLELGNTVFRFEHPATRGAVLDDDDVPTQTDEDAFDEEVSTVVGHSKPHNIAPSSSRPVPRPSGRRRKPVTLPPAHGGDGHGLPSLNKNLPLLDTGPKRREPLSALAHEQPSAPSSESFGRDDRPLGAVAATPPPIELPRPPGGRLDSMLPASGSASSPLSGSQPGMSAAPFGGFDSSDPLNAALAGHRLGSDIGEVPSLKKSRRGLVVGALALAVIGVGAAIAFVLLRPRFSGQVAENTAPAVEERRARSLPASTWGTNESALVASAGTTIPVPVEDSATTPETIEPDSVDPDADDAQTDGLDEDGTDAEADADGTDPAAGKTDDAEPDDSASDEAESDEAESDEAEPDKAVKSAARPKVTKKTTRKRSKKPSSKARAASARSSAQSKYKSKQFDAAAKILRSAAGNVSKKDASSLRSLASKYETIGTQMSKGNANQAKNAAVALSAYEKAYKADKSAGGAYSAFLRGKLQKVAPKAATDHMAKKRYESAKSAADKADAYGAGKSALVKRVRSNLESKAQQLYKSALKDKKKNPKQARKNLQRILKMVPKSSKNYSKALNLLSKIT